MKDYLADKIARVDTPIHELLRARWSPRAFADRDIEREKLQALMEAARWAASSFNEQPWGFVIADRRNREEFETLLGCLGENNRLWARHAPLLILTVAKLHFQHNGKRNRHAYHDLGLAVGNLTVQATQMGLYLHQLAGFSGEQARQVYRIPETHDPVTVLVIGYLGDPQQLPDRFRERELATRTRKPLSDFVYSGTWNQTHPDFG